MPFYQRLGDVPRKRHVQFRENGTLLTEEVMGLEGFTGNESILYHLHSPCRVMDLAGFEPIVREEWLPEQHAHRHLKTYPTEPQGDEITGRRTLMWNDDVEISLCRPSASMDYHYRNGEGDEVIFVHEGSGTLETIFGDVPYKDGDYVVVPRGTTYRFRPAKRLPEADSVSTPGVGGSADDASSFVPQRHLVFETPGLIEIPKRYRNVYGQLMEGAPYYHRDIHPPTELRTVRERGEFPVKVRVRGGYQTYVVDYHPFDVVGWDGYLYPWTFSIHDFEPITGRIHQPPPSHQTFQGPNFVICSFCPRKLDFDPLAVPIPYHHSNLQSEEMIYYVSGSFGSRRGVEVGSITLHPSGLPHGPQPGLAEASIGMHETTELAVMCDTFHPLRLSTFARDLDDGRYMLSWFANAEAPGDPAGDDASGAGLTSHL
jgi:homogentisate 1,2-dioxygenase